MNRKILYSATAIIIVGLLLGVYLIQYRAKQLAEIKRTQISAGYLAYVDEGDIVIGNIIDDEAAVSELKSFVNSIEFGDYKEISSGDKVPEAWMILYNADEEILGRMNFYDNGKTVYYDDKTGVMETKKYSVSPVVKIQLMELTDKYFFERQTTVAEEAAETEETVEIAE